MKRTAFIPDHAPEFYHKHYFNVLKYKELTANPDYKHLFVARDFVILLWNFHDRVLLDKKSHVRIIRYYSSLGLSKRQLLYLLENLLLTFDKCFFPDLPIPENDDDLNFSLDLISVKCDKLSAELNPNVISQCFLFDFTLIEKNLKMMPDIIVKIKYLEDVYTDFDQYDDFPGLSRQIYFKNKCKHLLKKYRDILERDKIQAFTSLPEPTAAARYKSFDDIRKYSSDKIKEQGGSSYTYFFFSENDLFLLVNTFSDFFYSGHINPNFSLILKPRCKTSLCIAINSIYSRFGEGCLKYNKEFLSLLQKLSVFNGQTHDQIYRAVIKSHE